MSETGPPSPRNPQLREELLRRAETDQHVRQTPDGTFRPLPEMGQVDADNSARIREIIDTHGWPGHSLVGADGTDAAWLLVQHAPHDLQQTCLPLLDAAVDAGEATPAQLAYLTDRILVRRGLPQRYGTQYRSTADGDLELSQVEDPDRLDRRRASVGLGTHAQSLAEIRHRYGPRPATDPDDSPSLHITHHDGRTTLAIADTVILPIYLASHQDVIDDPFYSSERFLDRLRNYAQAPGFHLVATHAANQMVGLAFGYTLGPTSRWWHGLTTPVPAGFTAEDGTRTFAFNELMVHPD
ncbi:MAG: hypothetical protein L0Y54_21275 [Sporichthyaceae bacterium]|nr:hypothetical protein [Sporichthyaceae bacterium]